jgi:hypothetical protein
MYATLTEAASSYDAFKRGQRSALDGEASDAARTVSYGIIDKTEQSGHARE